ncbi:MAG: hypothetical protein IPN36_01715 [Bacteroidetes bacterium]|nr:hypothetical protein [Bacteroidota bacterium]
MKPVCGLFLIICQFLTASVSAQEIEWQQLYGYAFADELKTIEQTTDGGFICGGYSDSKISGNPDYDYYIAKFDSNGNFQWDKNIGSADYDFFGDIIQTSDGGYILGGGSLGDSSRAKTADSKGGEDFWILKIDSVGNILWDKTIGGSGSDRMQEIIEMQDGGFLCAGYSYSGISGDKTEANHGYGDYWILRLDSSANIIWQKTIGSYSNEQVEKMVVDNSGNIIIGDYYKSSSKGYQYIIWKLDSLGNPIWFKNRGGLDAEYLHDLIVTSDGGYLCAGSSKSDSSGAKTENCKGEFDYWIVKLGPAGNIQWQRTIGGQGVDMLFSVSQTADGGFICGGYSNSNISGDKTEACIGQNDYWIMKVDSTGTIIWQNTIGGSSEDALSTLVIADDGCIVVGGKSYSENSGDKTSPHLGIGDNWILKINTNSNLINGKVFTDINLDTAYTTGENTIDGLKITESTTGRFSFTNAYGNYSLAIFDTGQYLISPSANIPYYNPNPLVHTASFTGLLQSDSLNDFAYQPAGNFDDLCMSISPVGAFRPGFNGNFMLNYKNVGTTTQNPTIVFHLYPNVSFVSASVPPSAVYPDSVVWNQVNFTPFQQRQILVTVNLDPSLPIGSILNSYAQIRPIDNDFNPSCNNATWEVTVTGSLDPNDIIVNQDTVFSTVFPNPPFLEYLIRFQNTGTDTAFTIKILNPLDTFKLDLNTLEFVAASHPMDMRFIYHERSMEFLFNNIFLPDSNVNESASHGFVRYRIKPKSNLQSGDTIKNFAAIYFDFNEPVITNTAKRRLLHLQELIL